MSDLTPQEQTNVRTALKFLHSRVGGWEQVRKMLRFTAATLSNVAGKQAVSATLAFRVARVVKVPIEDLLTGTFPPPGTCPYCGHRPDT